MAHASHHQISAMTRGSHSSFGGGSAVRQVIGVMGAMEPEIAMLLKHVTGVEATKVNATLTCYKGTFGGKVRRTTRSEAQQTRTRKPQPHVCERTFLLHPLSQHPFFPNSFPF
jgi:hypothetical protein